MECFSFAFSGFVSACLCVFLLLLGFFFSSSSSSSFPSLLTTDAGAHF